MLKSHFPTAAYSGLSMTRLIARRLLLVIQLTTALLTQVGKKYKKNKKTKMQVRIMSMFKKLHLPLCNVSGMPKESDGLLQLGSYSQGFDLTCH